MKGWNESQLRLAYEAVRGGMSVRRAATEFCVPKSTLFDRLCGKVAFGAVVGLLGTSLTKKKEN